VGRRTVAPQRNRAIQARVEIAVDPPLRRMLAEQQHALAAFRPAGRLARDAQHVDEVAHVDQSQAQHACGRGDRTGMQHVAVADQDPSMGAPHGHRTILT
jgi:hypothetical protein